jgi:hypothetical protein
MANHDNTRPGGRVRFQRAEPVTWSHETAYAVGLVATDGFLTARSRVGFGSRDRELVEAFLRCVGRPVRYSEWPAGRSQDFDGRLITTQHDYFAALGYDPLLYEFFRAAGVGRRKSHTIGALVAPSEYLWDLIRGLMDGDGSVMSSVRAPQGTADPYRLLRLRVIFYSASRPHLEWLRGTLANFSIRSSIYEDSRPGHESFRLELSDRQAAALLCRLYADPNAPRLERKWRVWDSHQRSGRLRSM